MDRRFGTLVPVLALMLAGLLDLSARPASAQGPYGRNSYEDFPFNQGSLFYRPLKPNDPPRRKPATATRPRATAPANGAVVRPGYPMQAVPYASAPARRRRFFLFGR